MTTHAQQRAEQLIDQAFAEAGMPRAQRRATIHALKSMRKKLGDERADALIDEVLPPASELENGVANLWATLRNINRAH